MAYLLCDTAICIVGLFFIGHPLTRLSRAIEGAERLPWALILGICTTIVFIRTINTVAAMDKALPFIVITLAVWLAYHWHKKTLRNLFHDAIYYITNARWMLGHSFDERVPEGPHHQVTIAPMGRAVSPSILVQSNDDRILTYQVSKLALSTDATFQPVICGSAP